MLAATQPSPSLYRHGQMCKFYDRLRPRGCRYANREAENGRGKRALCPNRQRHCCAPKGQKARMHPFWLEMS
jgi:hypothetical protein